MSEINRLEWDAYIRDSELMSAINRIERKVGGMVDNVTQKGKDMETVFNRMAKAATAFFTISQAQNFIQEIIRVRSEFQQLEIAFSTMLGSKEKADVLIKDLVEFAGTTPFGMKDTANAAKQLLAYGSAAKEVKDELRMLGDIAAGTSQPIGDLVYLYGTLRTQGRAYLMDIRQFAGRGIPIYKELARVLGVAESQVNDLVSAGKVGFAEVQQALQNMTSAGSIFGGLMEAQSRTIRGELERLGDAYDQMLNNIGKDTEGLISEVIRGASIIVENYETVLNIITALIATYGAYRAALIATAAVQQIMAARAVGMSAAEMIHLGAITAKTAALKALNVVMMASPIVATTAGIMALSSAIYALTQVTNATTAAQERLGKAYEVGIAKADSERRSIEQLIAVIKDNTATIEDRQAAYNKLQSQTGGILQSFSLEEIAIGKATDALDKYIEKIGRAAAARKAFDEFNSLAEQLDELNRKGIDGISVWERTGRALQNAFGFNGAEAAKAFWGFGKYSQAGEGDKFLVEQQKDVIKKQMEALQKEFGVEFRSFITGVKDTVQNAELGNEFTKLLTDPIKNFNSLIKSVSNKAELDSLKKSLTEKLESLAPNDKQIGDIKAKLQQVAKLEEQYSLSKGKSPDALANQQFQATERYLSMLEQIEQARQNMLNNQLSSDEREIASAKQKYATLRDEIRKFNADPKNKTKIDASVVDAIEKEDLSNIRQQQANQKRLAQYEEDYQNYIKYEELKKQAGEKYANEQLGIYKNFVEDLQNEINALQGKQSTGGLSPIEEQYLSELLKKYNEVYEYIVNKGRSAYIEMLKLSSTTESKIHEIRERYSKAFEELEAKKTEFTEAEYNKRKEALKKAQAEELGNVLLPELKSNDSWINVFEKSATIARDKVKQNAELLKAELNKILKEGKISAEQYRDIINQIREVEIQISINERGFARLKAIIKELREAEKGSVAYDEARRMLGEQINHWAQGVASIGDELKNIFDQLNIGSEKFREDLSLTMDVVSNASNAAASIASGDYIGAVVNTIKTIGSVINLFSKDRKIERKIKAYQGQLEALGNTYDKLVRKMSDSDTDYYKKSDAVLKNLQEQEKVLKQMLQAEESKKKTDEEKVNSYKNSIQQIQQARADLEASIREMRLQTDVNNLAKSITDALVGAFEAGEKGIESMEKAFDDFIKQSLANSARLNFVQGIIEEMLNDVDKYMSSNNDSLIGYNFSLWQQKLENAGKQVYEFLESAYANLGLDKDSGTESSSLKSEGIERISEHTGTEILGTFRAGLDIWKRQYNVLEDIKSNYMNWVMVANNQLAQLNAIQVNTANTVARLDMAVIELKGIKERLR